MKNTNLHSQKSKFKRPQTCPNMMGLHMLFRRVVKLDMYNMKPGGERRELFRNEKQSVFLRLQLLEYGDNDMTGDIWECFLT